LNALNPWDPSGPAARFTTDNTDARMARPSVLSIFSSSVQSVSNSVPERGGGHTKQGLLPDPAGVAMNYRKAVGSTPSSYLVAPRLPKGPCRGRVKACAGDEAEESRAGVSLAAGDLDNAIRRSSRHVGLPKHEPHSIADTLRPCRCGLTRRGTVSSTNRRCSVKDLNLKPALRVCGSVPRGTRPGSSRRHRRCRVRHPSHRPVEPRALSIHPASRHRLSLAASSA